MQHEEQFLQLYQRYRYEDQYKFYESRRKEFTHARNQAFIINIVLISLVALAGPLETVSLTWFKFVCLFTAAICPVLSAALTGYNALYAFDQQAKLYQDAFHNLQRVHHRLPVVQEELSEADLAQHLSTYVKDVENILETERGQWGQLAESMRPPDL